jgi:pimeloyl-ACP methyl ester carboxylesterase
VGYGWGVEFRLGRRARTARGEIAWEVFGSGPPVVLVHGTPSRALVWRRVVPTLAQRHSVYVFDMLGFGESERRLDQDVSLVAHGEVLAELLDRWQLERPGLIGHDIGGAVVLRAALVEGVAPSRIALLDAVVLAPWMTDRTRTMQRDVEQLMARVPDDQFGAAIESHLRSATTTHLDDDLFGALFGQWTGELGQRLYLRNLACFDESHTDEIEERLDEIDVPVLILWGERDAWLDPAISDRIAKRIRTAQRVIVPDAGHFSMEDQPTRVTEELARFLS